MIRVPGDKSISHRALMLSALATGESRVRGLLPGADCKSTASVLRALGTEIPAIPEDGSEIVVVGKGPASFRTPAEPLDCGNSGTTARLMLGLLAGLPLEASLTGDASLRSRPMRRVSTPLAQMGARFTEEGEADRLPMRVHGGKLEGMTYRSPVASAQIKSALLLAGLTGKVPVEVIEPLRSRDHSERMLRRMGVEIQEEAVEGGWKVGITPPVPPLRPLDLLVPGDFSSAAFFIAFGLLGGAGGELRIANVGLNPTRVGLLDLLREMGGDILVENLREGDSPEGEPAGDLVVRPSELRGGSVGGERIPLMIDEIPILAVLAARVNGVTEIRDAEELRVKESDRIRVMVENMEGLGAKVEELPDGLRVHGSPTAPLSGSIRAHHDHRIAMAFGVLGALPNAEVAVDDPAVADVSFPGFWELLANLSAGRS